MRSLLLQMRRAGVISALAPVAEIDAARNVSQRISEIGPVLVVVEITDAMLVRE